MVSPFYLTMFGAGGMKRRGALCHYNVPFNAV
ncbi:hypothetical protein EM595_p0246 (plasmid) [Duffyella gerundensis]|uniref:Uncharacterized protein n=1 Tax=Duffyella gerundensis TaxID=1619313 RepID=A0A0U5L9E0_9GAMM|nr:hypothetical protein EM595_p0246 [Duffyella gerundensis]